MADPYAEQFFRDCNGLTYHYPNGCWWKIEVRRVRKTPARPGGLRYALAFFRDSGSCLVRYDNAHAPGARQGKARAYDHWHRFSSGETVAYDFVDLQRLIEDFFRDVDLHLPPELRSR